MQVNEGPNIRPTANLHEWMMRRAIPWLVKEDGGDSMFAHHVTDLKTVLHKIPDTVCTEHIGLSFKGVKI